ncbi:DNA recombination protein RmuC [Desulfovirgula thermocuniculi]|uniref:DNA recombination protein RmuC n=1 Tax=Desulfovirgula thermocuniculi TaxID=348842 RepID=UPI00040F63A2|nr:DNA recombination protein RmuC [Desulfovirgula thermocuniculi]
MMPGEAVWFLCGLALGALLAGLLALWRQRFLEARARSAELLGDTLRQQVERLSEEVAGLRDQLLREQEGRVRAEAALAEQRRALEEAGARLADTFKALSADALHANSQALVQMARQALESVVLEARGDLQQQRQAIDALIRPLKEELARYEAQVRAMESARREAYGSLMRQLEELQRTQQLLQKETGNLVTALKMPQVRGRWGEITLRRAVEVAGLSPYCDFAEQVPVEGEGGRLRPDLVVKLPGDRTVVVDAKVPLKAYLEAMESGDEGARQAALARHARAVREHMQALASKAYWSQFDRSPDFVVLFLPGESFFAAALEQDRHLIEDGLACRVLLATPTTLIALLRAVALSWQQHALTENARLIAQAGAELYERLCRFSEHLGRIKDGLQKAVSAYNSAVGSWEGRVAPGARRLKELGAVPPGRELGTLEGVGETLRTPEALT